MNIDLGICLSGSTAGAGTWIFIDLAENPLLTVLKLVYILFCAVLFGFGGLLIQETILKKHDKWIGKKSSKQQLGAF